MSYMCKKFAGRECTGCGACHETRAVGICEHCGEEIHEGEEYYDIEDVMLHEDCLYDWAKQYKVS